MDRRNFIKRLTATTAAVTALPHLTKSPEAPKIDSPSATPSASATVKNYGDIRVVRMKDENGVYYKKLFMSQEQYDLMMELKRS